MSPLAIFIVKNHHERTWARHRFNDITERMFPSDRMRLKEKLDKHLARFEELRLKRKYISIDQPTFLNEKRQISRTIVTEFTLELSTIEFQEKVMCSAHNTTPPARSDPQLARVRWSECGENVCIPWSRVGANTRWIHVSTLSTFCWGYSIRFYNVDSVYQENAVNFDRAVFETILCSGAIPETPRTVYCPCGFDTSAPSSKYQSDSCVFSPSHLGLWGSRHRNYLAFHRGGVVSVC